MYTIIIIIFINFLSSVDKLKVTLKNKYNRPLHQILSILFSAHQPLLQLPSLVVHIYSV